MREIRILPEVWDDAHEAASWYDKQGGKELGDRFLASPQTQFREMVQHAGTHRLIYKAFSHVFAKPFPYAIYFRIHQDWEVGTLMWHTARNPGGLKAALDERSPQL